MPEIIMRTEKSKQGLRDMINYINRISSTKNLLLLEIGSYAGDSTEIFCQSFKEVISIDPWISNIGDITNRCDMEQVYQNFIKRMEPYKNITVIRKYSYKIAQQFEPESIDVLYIDGSHEEPDVKQDILLYKGLVKPGGFICGHDYWNKFPGTVKAIDETLGKPQAKFIDSSWVIRKK
jgi:predicted O-methyltransferase YrrM